MEKSVRSSRAFLVLLGAALAGCGSDSPTENTVGASGSLSFSYTGAGASSATQYSATGAIPSNVAVNNGTQPWAAGGVDAGSTVVWAVVPKSSNNWDMTFINIERTTPGTATIAAGCTSNCADVAVWFGANNNETNYTYYCALSTGSVTISAISSTSASGTFSGTGTCSAAAGGDTPFTVTNGTFSVGLSALLQQ
jgi:hypothetical protein